MSNRRQSPRQMLGTVVVILILAVVIYLNRDAQPQSLVLTPPPESLPAASQTPLPASSTEVEAPTDLPAFPAAEGADFDYYVLSLSWSPQYCATDGSDDAQQCSLGRKLGFVLHGLWPQYERGYPSYCSEEPFPADLRETYAGLYPSDALFKHEWEKHGTCSGLGAADYLEASRQLWQGLVLPAAYQQPEAAFRTTAEELQADFTSVNPALEANSLAVLCSDAGRFLREVRVCFTAQGLPRACSDEVLKGAAKSCGQADFLVRNVK